MNLKLEIDTDTFFLTAPFATADLKAKMEELKDQLYVLQGECAEAQSAHDQVRADLSKMEDKAAFVQTELFKNLAIFTPPPEDDTEKRYETLLNDVFNPLADASLYLGGGGAALWAIGAGGPKMFKLMSKLPKMGAVGKVGKSAKWMKLAKIGKASGVLSAAVFLVEAGLRMHSASEINAHFKAKAAEIKKQVDEATGIVDDLKEVTAEARALRQQLLDEGGFATVEEYTRGLNEAIAALGRQRASLSAARRMFMEGLPGEMIARFVPDLPAEAVASLERKLKVERALLDGLAQEQILARVSDVTQGQVAQIVRAQQARMQLLEGMDEQAVQQSSRLPAALIEAEAEVLSADLRQAWSMLESNTPPEQIAQKCLFSITTIEAFEREHDAKELFYAGQGLQQVGAAIDAAQEQLSRWQGGLNTSVENARLLLQQGSAGQRMGDIAADLRVPMSVLRQLEAA